MSGLLYRFPQWAEEHVGSRRPVRVERWFTERGLQLSDETWRKFLRDEPPPTIVLETWSLICEVSECRLSEFFEYTPTGGALPPRRNPKKLVRTLSKPGVAEPPNPADFIRSSDV
jgi:hypothetical protein